MAHLSADPSALPTSPRTVEQQWVFDTFSASERAVLFNQGGAYLDNRTSFTSLSITGYSLSIGDGQPYFATALVMHGSEPLVLIVRNRDINAGGSITTATRGSDSWSGSIEAFKGLHPYLLPNEEIIDGNRFFRNQNGWAIGLRQSRWLF